MRSLKLIVWPQEVSELTKVKMKKILATMCIYWLTTGLFFGGFKRGRLASIRTKYTLSFRSFTLKFRYSKLICDIYDLFRKDDQTKPTVCTYWLTTGLLFLAAKRGRLASSRGKWALLYGF